MVEREPIFKGALYNTTVSANTDFFGSNLEPAHAPATFLIYFFPSSGSASLPRIKMINGENTVIEILNVQSTNVTYVFQTIVAPGDSINLTSSGGCSIGTLIVVEVEMMRGEARFDTPRMG